MSLESSELILNEDQSIYHLSLKPEDLAPTVILVGDPGRVSMVSERFDRVEVRKSHREFVTHTGWLGSKRLSVVSTGIGTDNIDITLNELDALVNIDFITRRPHPETVSLDLVRLGTSGAIQKDIPVDGMVLSDYAVGFDGLLHFYQSSHIQEHPLQDALSRHLQWYQAKAAPYVVKAHSTWSSRFKAKNVITGITATNSGFYAPQGRRLRLAPQDEAFLEKLGTFRHGELRVTNMEMETAGIFGLARLMGHRAASLNCILANRPAAAFSADPHKAVVKLIDFALEQIAAN